MSYMIVGTQFSSPDGHAYLKCKRCKQEFYVVSAARYLKTVCYCPYCGQQRTPKKYSDDTDYYNWHNEYINS